MEYKLHPSLEGVLIGEDGTVWKQVAAGPVRDGGYRTVMLEKRSRRVHRLVLETFIGPCPEGFVGHHVDGNTLNNAARNLGWVERKLHMVYHLFAASNGRTVLNAELVGQIWKLRKEGLSYARIGATLGGLNRYTVRSVLQEKSWKAYAPLKEGPNTIHFPEEAPTP